MDGNSTFWCAHWKYAIQFSIGEKQLVFSAIDSGRWHSLRRLSSEFSPGRGSSASHMRWLECCPGNVPLYIRPILCCHEVLRFFRVMCLFVLLDCYRSWMNANDDIDTNIKSHDKIYFPIYNIHLSVIWFIPVQLYISREYPDRGYCLWLSCHIFCLSGLCNILPLMLAIVSTYFGCNENRHK